jgi:hypothetical protein
VQRIPGWGKKVERVVKDAVADASWPKFLHPYPLGRPTGEGSGKCFLVACQPTPESLWGIYLVDVFDNLLLLREEPDYALLEPVPIQPRPAPPVIPDRVQPERTNSLVYLVDVYAGPGLRGIPRGEVKALRVFTYVYGYRGMGGLYGTIGMNGPWDMRRVLGTVPVEEDGSAYFRIPAKGLSPWLLRPQQVVCRHGRRLSEDITGIGGAFRNRRGLPTLLGPIAMAHWFHLSVLSGKRRVAGSASALDLPSLSPSVHCDRRHHL